MVFGRKVERTGKNTERVLDEGVEFQPEIFLMTDNNPFIQGLKQKRVRGEKIREKIASSVLFEHEMDEIAEVTNGVLIKRKKVIKMGEENWMQRTKSRWWSYYAQEDDAKEEEIREANKLTIEELKEIFLNTEENDEQIYEICVEADCFDGYYPEPKRFIGTKHEAVLSTKFRVPFDIGHSFYIVGASCMDGSDASSKMVTLEALDLNNPRTRRKKEHMQMLRRKMTETPAEYEMQGQITICGRPIPMTKRELIETGLDPDLMGWISLEQAKRKAFREKYVLIQCEALSEIDDIFKHLNTNILNKIPQKFKDFVSNNKSKTYKPSFDHRKNILKSLKEIL